LVATKAFAHKQARAGDFILRHEASFDRNDQVKAALDKRIEGAPRVFRREDLR
jgi:hypothetical protein